MRARPSCIGSVPSPPRSLDPPLENMEKFFLLVIVFGLAVEVSSGRYKTWTVDSGLDHGLDHGLDYGPAHSRTPVYAE